MVTLTQNGFVTQSLHEKIFATIVEVLCVCVFFFVLFRHSCFLFVCCGFHRSFHFNFVQFEKAGTKKPKGVHKTKPLVIKRSKKNLKKCKTSKKHSQNQAVKWLDLFLEIVKKLGYECDGQNLAPSQTVYVIDDYNPKLITCKTIRKQSQKKNKGEEHGWLLQIATSQNPRTTIQEKYKFWYPEWMIFHSKNHANQVLQELLTQMNQQ